MLKVKCPECGSVKIDRINTDVAVYAQIMIEEVTDYVIEGGEEFPIKFLTVRADETEPPYIEELDSGSLEFACSNCGYFFEDCNTDEDFARIARDWGLVVWCVE